MTAPLVHRSAHHLRAHREQRAWLRKQLAALTTELEVLSPSEWAESKRYLPPSVTPMPGYYRYEVAPYLREIVDCFGVESPIREVSVMKGAQVCFTVGVLENVIGYNIDHVKTAPMLLVTADAELAKIRMEQYITPMLEFSRLQHLIQSSDPRNARKTGHTDKKLEWMGGGFLIPLGAQNADKFRSVSMKVLLGDETDAWPLVVGNDGDPVELVRSRTAGYELDRKILNGSTPTIVGLSKIAQLFEQGDQRRYFVCCVKCGFAQVLRWSTNDASGQVGGMVWELDRGVLVPDSVRYLCRNCQHPHTNDDKTRLLAPENGAEWRPTARPASPDHRSYHIPALLSPVGMQTWTALVELYLKAWDSERGKARDLAIYQVFYNNALGQPFELHGERVRFEAVSAHRRTAYRFGEIPNKWAAEFCGGTVQVLTCSVDVHKDRLNVTVFGWTRGRRALLIDYLTLEGDPEQLDDAATWGELEKLIDHKRYTADDGAKYGLAITLVDSGYSSEIVYSFCHKWTRGVFPIKGREDPPKGTPKEFAEFRSALGVVGYGIVVDRYKDRWSAALKHGWDGLGLQPEGHFNAPLDVTDKQLRELTVEIKRPKADRNGKRTGHEWYRPSGAANELWDLLVYASAALDMLAWDYFGRSDNEDGTDWAVFFDDCEKDGLFLSD